MKELNEDQMKILWTYTHCKNSGVKFNTPVLWEVHTKLVLILTPVGVSLTIWCVI